MWESNEDSLSVDSEGLDMFSESQRAIPSDIFEMVGSEDGVEIDSFAGQESKPLFLREFRTLGGVSKTSPSCLEIEGVVFDKLQGSDPPPPPFSSSFSSSWKSAALGLPVIKHLNVDMEGIVEINILARSGIEEIAWGASGGAGNLLELLERRALPVEVVG
ncbi:hypothetical protein ARMGADRAFT_1039521 [Armillaria gallica]|uniref:Uncharacterized protein n=1 Tax=Armillaria gallica TaxID=47427 RepID=A0A2H3CGZ2_ARMGA|nr:hypothetical protein ARMGADRAFT_1039521 [Armillaria gallica]